MVILPLLWISGFALHGVTDLLDGRPTRLLSGPGPKGRDSTGQAEARAAHYAGVGLELPTDFDPLEAFFHDVPVDVVHEAIVMGEQPARSDTLFSQPWPLANWPSIPTRFLLALDDRFFPLEFQRRLVKERLGIDLEEIPGGHLAALSQPQVVAGRVASHLAEVTSDS